MDAIADRIGDEVGLTRDDLARLYGISDDDLTDHLASLGADASSAYEQALSDIDAVRVGYRQLKVTDGQIEAVRGLLRGVRFRPIVAVPMAVGGTGWRLSSDDAQWVAFRAADVVGMDYEWSEVLRQRLKRVVIWPDAPKPELDSAFRDRVADITFYLIELSGVL